MIEKIYEFKALDEKLIEKIVDDDNLVINHMILTKDTGLPEHFSNSNVYMVITKGKMTIKLNDQEPHIYEKGTILNIPFNIKMNVNNFHDEVLEFFVVKVPNPKDMPK
ncbi:cupin domain-containing protein [Caloramator sp. CAR-1]|uniref:cupin domain-containing protein n=1 Tax=Caloramator sp. CAR-1 TaxID=3062777 RepID=UPI0026E36D9D|nr:cupin domain-containing protein [Caloramator sp. CAR-1]MDO6355521.1 cupin domain-containing protein [Caloramator sp. CAR-1]